MILKNLNHFVLTVTDIDTTCRFCEEVLGMSVETFRDNRKALKFGSQNINLHRRDHEIEPKADRPTPGSADLCFITDTAIDAVFGHLSSFNIPIIEGPVERAGANGTIPSVYIRDPDLNLIEISRYLS
jgi:catechol 2,3-dioxygenase-like lactoylglutathione lyase family enzyme